MTETSSFAHPSRECTLVPFWFWNDQLDDREIVRQIDDFCDHGVYGFVIHPRVGLPRQIGFMSDAMLDYMQVAIDHAARRGLTVVLYDEGMYPSGSASGQVVAENRAYACRGMVPIDLDAAAPGEVVRGVRIGADGEPALAADQTLVAIVTRPRDGHRLAIIDRPIDAHIRGIHYAEEEPARRSDGQDPPEDEPPAADLLNPDATACFIRKVYQRFYDRFAPHFGATIIGMFTDEPNLTGKLRERPVAPGTTGILQWVSHHLGSDFTPHLHALFDEDPQAARYRRIWNDALHARLEETYYGPLHRWCSDHGVALMGHPSQPDEIAMQRYFHIPGQDVVWRYIEPGKPTALQGPQSTQAKCSSSAMIHLGRRRNSNECLGAYGHNLTYHEMVWLMHWLLVRGVNMLIPHAFYYSVRGARVDERPPDVGPNSPWWDGYRAVADACRRLCWLNIDSQHVCRVAILGRADRLPWHAAKVLYQHQIDFNYLDGRTLAQDATVGSDGIRIAGMHYGVLVIDPSESFEAPAESESAVAVLRSAGRLVTFNGDPSQLVTEVTRRVGRDVVLTPPCPAVRVRHIIKDGADWYMLHNEGDGEVDVALTTGAAGGAAGWMDAVTGELRAQEDPARLVLPPFAMRVLRVVPPGTPG